MKVWQIATGEPSRDYRELFFDHDVMILGPGRHGNALSGEYAKGRANSAMRQNEASSQLCFQARAG